MPSKEKLHARLIGVELYLEDLRQGKQFYGNALGLELLKVALRFPASRDGYQRSPIGLPTVEG